MKTILEEDKDYICDIQAPCFQMLSEEEMNLVQHSKTQVHFRKGDMLTKQGTFASYILFVISGIVKQYVESDNNKSYNLKIIRSGEFVGLSSVFSNNKYSYSTVALTECKAFLVEKDSMEHLIRKNGNFGFNIINRYYTQNAELFETLRNVLFKQMNGRLADTLLYLDSIKGANPEIFQILSRKEIADFAGISTESAVKLLKSWETEKLIELKEKDIIVLDKIRLDKIRQIG
jgi:CRP-like cAMP-binding protein